MYGLLVNSLRNDTMSFGGVKDVPISVLLTYSGGRSPRVAHVLSNCIMYGARNPLYSLSIWI